MVICEDTGCVALTMQVLNNPGVLRATSMVPTP